MNQPGWCVVVNPAAGRRRVTGSEVSAAFEHAGVPATVHVTTSVAHLTSLVRQQAAIGQRDFAVVGGDGSAHHALNAMMTPGAKGDDRFALAIIASGSGSDFVRTFGHAGGLGAGVSRLIDPDRYPIDIGRVRGTFGESYFLNALNVGVAAQSARTARRLPRWTGRPRYAIGFWIALARFPTATVHVRVGRHTFQGDAITVVAANGQFFGGGMNVAPRAALTDGRFDVQVFHGPRRNALSVMPRLMRGNHLTHRAVRRYVGGEIEIDVPDEWPVEADGEILGAGSVTAATIPSALDFIA